MIRRLFEKDLDGASDQRLFAHLRECESCEHAYQRYSTAEQAFAGDSLASDRVLRRVLGPSQPPAPARSFGWLIAPAVLALAMIGFATRAPEQPEFAVRGGAADVSRAIRVLVIRLEGSQANVSDLASGGVVRPGDHLRILCSTVAARTIHAMTISLPSGDRVTLGAAVALPAGTVEAPLGDIVEITRAWGTGAATLRIDDFALPFTVAGE